MKIQVNDPILTLQGEPYTIGNNETLTLGMVLAEALATSIEGGKMKCFLLAQKCYAGKDFDADTADLAIMRKALESLTNSPYSNNLISGQALEKISA